MITAWWIPKITSICHVKANTAPATIGEKVIKEFIKLYIESDKLLANGPMKT